jgi:hypothetical protein
LAATFKTVFGCGEWSMLCIGDECQTVETGATRPPVPASRFRAGPVALALLGIVLGYGAASGSPERPARAHLGQVMPPPVTVSPLPGAAP